MRTSRIIFVIGAALAATSVGCAKETIDSTNIKTAGIAALIDVTANSASASLVHVDLKTGGAQSNTFVILSSGDRLLASADGQQKTMEAVEEGEYEAEFGTGAADTEFLVSLERDADTPAPASRGTLPAPFEISAPASGADASRAEDLVVTWDAGDGSDDVALELNGDCIFLETIDVPGDSGSYTIAAGTLKPTNSDKPESCDVTLQITRSRSGSADPAFDGESWVHLRQVRAGSFTSTP
jgi:hypothetical protein